ncbi:hypothetical protein B0H34DRAFT_800392 [Crassisporium funariophilum]|nr:hypothetical protein B0H34DRAFT_800392 [Crassisporium funariophilum]
MLLISEDCVHLALLSRSFIAIALPSVQRVDGVIRLNLLQTLPIPNPPPFPLQLNVPAQLSSNRTQVIIYLPVASPPLLTPLILVQATFANATTLGSLPRNRHAIQPLYPSLIPFISRSNPSSSNPPTFPAPSHGESNVVPCSAVSKRILVILQPCLRASPSLIILILLMGGDSHKKDNWSLVLFLGILASWLLSVLSHAPPHSHSHQTHIPSRTELDDLPVLKENPRDAAYLFVASPSV